MAAEADLRRGQHEVDRVIISPETPEAATETETFRKTTVLKLLLRSIQRMMQSSGTAEGLRNLVDSSLMHSLQRIFENSEKVGSSVFALSLNVVATFVHNEPTSLTVIQEMQLHESLLEALQRSKRPTFEVRRASDCERIAADLAAFRCSQLHLMPSVLCVSMRRDSSTPLTDPTSLRGWWTRSPRRPVSIQLCRRETTLHSLALASTSWFGINLY